ncbi:MAG: DUF418 domain-containing protein [Geothrix sp.]|uniref:DUF418 domain-containing protein n=2 Tax=Geothrix sp. TaxID=1962974 RepID=UPI00181EC60F|nr:DUF418 domain-containing protein [Geothrix sp.]NWJ39816.1 DUF418 domain-containing protein [Geothrix sp.]WIL22171.1 MAG: DUF418 domain-containing protein [Geothrix sp.]
MDTQTEPDLPTLPAESLAPLREEERIQALDVVRGFALIGIFLMNVEWFNRASGEMNLGLPTGLTGANWWASRLIYVFVQGKFWTMFSLLFGMGFAVMLMRAERAGRNFVRPYLRRIAALAVFGAAHHILLWSGDILFSYAVAALALLVLLYGNWKYVIGGLVVFTGLGFIPKCSPLWAVAGSLAYVGVVALFLRGEKRLTIRGRSLPLFSFILLVLGGLAAVAAGVFWALPHGPKEPRIPVTIISLAVLTLGVLSARFHQPVEARMRRLGMTIYLLPFLMTVVFGVVQRFTPPPPPLVASPSVAQEQPAAAKPGEKKARKSEAEKRAEEEVERAKRIREFRAEIQEETRVHAKGRYWEAVKFRAAQFAKNAPGEAGFATIVIGMFLLGAWFVRSGVMTDTRGHLPLFRKLALIALPVGVGLGLLGSAIATSHTPGDQRDGFQLAIGLQMIGNLPACLGYVGALVLMLHSDTAFSKIRILAPVGRMALTNYLMQSVISTTFFFGHGFGRWGMGRAWQVVFVAMVFSLQIAWSHWWLGRFRFGPMEWLWRAITYWQIPPMRLAPAGTEGPLRPIQAPM